MFSFLALLTRKRYWRFHSRIIKSVLKSYGVRVGTDFHIEGTPRLKIAGKAGNIVIGDNVNILGDIDLRNRENGRIVIEDDVKIENDCRFVAARDGAIVIGQGSVVGAFAIFNGGADILIGRKCLISARVSINANEHEHRRSGFIREQGFIHEPVVIEDDCLIGANVSVNKGVRIAKGSMIGANAVVTADTEQYSINAGIPARKIAERS